MTTDSIQKRKQELADLDDALTDEPVGYNDPHYFAFHQAAGRPRGVDPVAELCTAIEMKRKRATCQLFSGFRGSGKSTELLRAAGELAAAGHAVLFVSGNEVVNLSQPLEPTDLLVSVAAAVAVHVTKQRGASPAQQSLVRRLYDFFTKTEVDLTQVGLSTDPVKLTFALSRDPSFKARVQQALRGRLSEFAGQFQSFMADAKSLLDVDDKGPSPVLIVD